MEFLEVFGSGALRFVAIHTHDAQEAELFAVRCAKLVPSIRRNVDHIVSVDRSDRVANKDLTGAADDHDRVLMLVSLKGGMPIGLHLEIPELDRQIVAALEKSLAGDAFEVGSSVFFVWEDIDAMPAEFVGGLPNHGW